MPARPHYTRSVEYPHIVTTVRAMEPDDVEPAAQLLAQRHRRHRSSSPLLDSRFESPEATAREIRALWTADAASGAVAERGGRLVGYLLGHPKDAAVWGENIWVESAGMALVEGERPETARDLYAAAAGRWVEEGRTAHYTVVPAQDVRLVDAWFRLCFGLQHVHAVRHPGPVRPLQGAVQDRHDRRRDGGDRRGSDQDRRQGDRRGRLAVAGGAPAAMQIDLDAPAVLVDGVPAVPAPVRADVRVRRAEQGDVPVLGLLEVALPEHQALAPVFSAGRRPTIAQATAEWAESVDDERFTTFVAEVDGAVVGSAIGCALSASSLHTGLAKLDDAAFLAFAAVLPESRGRGVGRALAETVIEWAGDQGYRSIVTDWRATNLLSSRTWPRLGFEQTFLRLHRLIGH